MLKVNTLQSTINWVAKQRQRSVKIICLPETHATADQLKAVFPGLELEYSFYCKSRTVGRGGETHGGVAVLVKKGEGMQATHVSETSDSTMEQLTIRISFTPNDDGGKAKEQPSTSATHYS